MNSSTFILRRPENAEEWQVVKQLLMDYREEFNNDTCFSSFAQEMRDIEKLYALEGNIKLIAVAAATGEIAGCIALQPFKNGIAEMKRLYVRPAFRGYHLGKRLTQAILEKAAALGYEKVYLDTMKEMVTAQKLYASLGFEVIDAYDDQDLSRLICFGKTLHPE